MHIVNCCGRNTAVTDLKNFLCLNCFTLWIYNIASGVYCKESIPSDQGRTQ